MHASSLENMKKSLDRYVGRDFFTNKQRRVVDVGSNNVNGSYRPLFTTFDVEYIGLDLAHGEGVNIILNDPYAYPLDDEVADIVISGQMLEHCEFFWRAFEEMVRVLSPDGYLILIAPSAGPIHRYPVDCYRFYPDSFYALAKHAGCHVVAVWNDERGPWRDLTGVFSKNSAVSNQPPIIPEVQVTHGPVPANRPELEKTSGSGKYLDTLSLIHQTLQPQTYIEIGVRQGGSLALASCTSIAVDPAPHPGLALGPNVHFYRLTSDDFFDLEAEKAISAPVDMAFIDGMHLFEYVLRDFIAIERRCSSTSVIVIDDVCPNVEEQANRNRQTRIWTGDVWKIVACLRENRPDLQFVLLDTAPTGLLIVMGLNPTNQILTDRYNAIIAKFNSENWAVPPADVISRAGALASNNARLISSLRTLRTMRPTQPTVATVRAALKH